MSSDIIYTLPGWTNISGHCVKSVQHDQTVDVHCPLNQYNGTLQSDIDGMQTPEV